jgi:hypothetical protein
LELQSNGGFGSDKAGLTHSHSDQPVTVRYATSTGSQHGFGFVSFSSKETKIIDLGMKNQFIIMGKLESCK